MAFQIQDDILDMTGDADVIGKPVMSDEKNQKTTYPVLVGLEESKALVKSYTDHAVELLHTLSGENRFLENLFITLITRES